jgi:hypothetical protein
VRSAAKELGLERYCIPKNKLLIKRRRRGRRRRRFQCAKGQPETVVLAGIESSTVRSDGHSRRHRA